MKSVKFFSFLMSCGIFLAAPSFAMDNNSNKSMDNNSNKSSVIINEDNQKDKAILDREINEIRQIAIELQKNKIELQKDKEELSEYMKKYDTDEKERHKCICF